MLTDKTTNIELKTKDSSYMPKLLTRFNYQKKKV